MKVNHIFAAFTVLLMLTVSMSAFAIVQEKNLVGWWLFDDLTDEMDNWEDITLRDAKIEKGQLVVETGKWAHALEYTGPDITELTLATWVSLDSYAKTAGSALTLDKVSADQFCAIVWAERVDRQWMSGSSFFRRTHDFPQVVTEKDTGEMLFLAITYKDIGNKYEVTGYRNAESMGSYNANHQGNNMDLRTWSEGDAEAIWGKRHDNGDGNGPGNLNAHIEESRIYNIALTEADIQAIHKGDLPVEARGKLATRWAKIKTR